MKTYKELSPFYKTEKMVYVIETIEDWDEYERCLKNKDENYIAKYNPNFYSFKEDFIKYIGKIWKDKSQLKYTYDDIVYAEYKVIAIEDNDAMLDWYWILENVDNKNDIKYILANSYELENGLK